MKQERVDGYDPWSRPTKDRDSIKENRDDKDKKDIPSGDGIEESKKPTSQLSDLISLFEKLVFGGKGGRKPGGRGLGYIISSICAVLLVIWGFMGFYIVDEQERGVVLRFGKYIGELTPGLRWQPYFIDRVIVINVTRLRNFSARGTMLTEDENIVDITVEVQYVIQNVNDFVLKVRDPEISLRQATDSALRHVVGSTIMDQVITEGRAQVAADVTIRIQDYLDVYGTGIRVSRVNIQNADPPAEVKPAFEDVISAREDEVRFRNQARAYANAIVPQARGEARRIEEEGRGYRDAKISRATGDAERFLLLYREFRKAPEVTRNRLYLEAMEEVLANSNKILIDVSEGNNNLLYLPLDKIIARGEFESPPSSVSSSGRTTLSEGQVSGIVSRVLQELNKRAQQDGR